MLSFAKIRKSLKTHQKRLQFGENLQSISEIAKRAGVHRDTLYACLNGDRINGRTQYALSKVLEEIEAENMYKSKTKIMNISIGKNGANLNFGIGKKLFS
jgi:hypothetical protein